MALNIQKIVSSNATESWPNAVHIKRYPSGTLKFLVVGGKFGNNSDQISVVADAFGMYNFTVTADVPTKQYRSRQVTVYYDYAGQWTLLQEASRIVQATVQKTVTPKALMNGFDALYKADAIDPEFGEAVIAFGATALTPTAMDALTPKTLSSVTLNAAAFDYKNPVWFVADKAARKVHLFNNPADSASLIRYQTISQEFADAFAYYSPATHRRTVALFGSNGTVSWYNVRMEKQPDVVLPYRVLRVVLLKATGAFDPLFAVIDTDGKIHKLDSNFTEVSVKSDEFYVNCHDSLDAYITRDGRLVGTDVLPVYNDPTLFFYAFAPGTEDSYCFNRNTNKIWRYNIKAQAGSQPFELQDENRLRYPTTFTNPVTASLLYTAGSDTSGRRTFVDRTAAITDVTSRNWSYLSLMSNGATTQLYGYVARPTTTLTHTYIPTYGATLPTYDQPLGKTVTFTFTANFDDTDDILPITLPAGITWTAKVSGKEVTSVKNGDVVSITASHEYLTSQPFPFSVGRSTGLVEIVPDPYPDPFTFETIYDVPDYSWQQTVTKTLTGINQRLEFSVLIDDEVQNDRVEVYVNGKLTPAPVFMYNGDKFYLRVHHGYNITNIKVFAGEYETEYGIFTVSETEFDPVPNRAYAEVGKEYRTVTLTNDGLTALALTIDSDIGEFVQGGQAVTLDVGQSTYLKFTPTETNKKYQIKFGSSRYKYTWDIWTHDTWLDDEPAPVYSNGMVVKASDSIHFDAIPENFLTDIRIPAGILFNVDGTDVEEELDSRGVYLNSFMLLDVSCDSVLKMESYPSHQQPKVLEFSLAKVSWLHDFAGTVTYSSGKDSRPTSFAQEDLKVWFDKRDTDYTIAQYESFKVGMTDFGTQMEAIEHSSMPTWFDPFEFLSTLLAPVSFDREFDYAFESIANALKQTHEEWYLFAESFTDMPALELGFESLTNIKDGFVFELANDSVEDEFSNSTDTQTTKVVVDVAPLSPRPVNWNVVEDKTPVLPKVVVGVVVPKSESAKPSFVEDPDKSQASPAEPAATPAADVYDHGTDHKLFQLGEHTDYFAFEAANTDTYNFNNPERTAVSWYEQNIPASHHGMDWTKQDYDPYKIDMNTVRYVRYMRPIAEYEIAVPRWFDIKDQYQIRPTADFIFAPLTYKYLSSPTHTETLTVHPIDTHIEQKVDNDIYQLPTAVRRVVPPAVYINESEYEPRNDASAYKYAMTTPDLISKQVIITGDYAPRKLDANPYPVEKMKITMFVPETDYGEPDPLKKGYFATELEALQNAVNVWNKTPDEIFAIQQTDGSWTWAIDIPCGEYCGDFGCDTRGYLAGG